MPKRKLVISSKRSIKSQYKFQLGLIVAVVVLAVGGWFTFRKLSNPSGIYQIVESRGAVNDPSIVSRVAPTPAANCTSWFDGCNTCMVKNGVITGCTMKACKGGYQSPRCLNPADPIPTATPTSTPPANCTSWFDGCNTCMVKDGVITGCTMMACKGGAQTLRCLNPADPTPTPTSIPSSTATPTPKPMPIGVVGTSTPTPSPTLAPSPSAISTTRPSPTSTTTCQSKIVSISMTGSCGSQGFSSASYQCSDSGKVKDLSLGGCTDANTIYTQVRSICGTTCTTDDSWQKK